MDLQAIGKSLEWDLRGLAPAVGCELVGMGFFFIFFFFSRFKCFRVDSVTLLKVSLSSSTITLPSLVRGLLLIGCHRSPKLGHRKFLGSDCFLEWRWVQLG